MGGWGLGKKWSMDCQNKIFLGILAIISHGYVICKYIVRTSLSSSLNNQNTIWIIDAVHRRFPPLNTEDAMHCFSVYKRQPDPMWDDEREGAYGGSRFGYNCVCIICTLFQIEILFLWRFIVLFFTQIFVFHWLFAIRKLLSNSKLY